MNWSYLWREWIHFGRRSCFSPFHHRVCGTVLQGGRCVDGKHAHDGERLMVDKLTYRFREPRRGEIIVLNVPGARFIKRIIAVGGDTIEERNGVIHVNGEAIDEPYVDNKTNMNWGPFRVPEGHVWVMGDNRPRSNDSRGTVGFLPVKNIVGRAIFRYWPLNRISGV